MTTKFLDRKQYIFSPEFIYGPFYHSKAGRPKKDYTILNPPKVDELFDAPQARKFPAPWGDYGYSD